MIQQTVPPLSTQLTTLQAVQDELGVDSEPRMLGLVNQASAACCGFCGRSFARATWAETFGCVSETLVLSRLPVVSVASVACNGTVVDPADLDLDAEAGLIRQYGAHGPNYEYSGLWEQRVWRPSRTVVIYTAGYLLPNDPGRTLPDDVERACLEMVKALWFSSGSGARDPGVRSDSTEGIGTTQYRDPIPGAFGLPSMAMDMLTPYRRLT